MDNHLKFKRFSSLKSFNAQCNMPVSPLLTSENVISYEILINGSKTKDTVELMSIEIDRSIFRISTAKITIALPIGTSDDDTFSVTESDDFTPGQAIEIKLGYVDDNETVFSGIIVNMGIRNLSGALNELVVRCSDKTVKMTQGRKSAYYQDMKESAIISAITGDYGLTNDVDATTVQHKQLVKYQANDWDFLISRAEANGLLVYTEDGKVLAKKPLASGSPALSIEFGRDVLNFDCGIESRFQAPSVSCSAWDMKTQAMIEGASSEPSLNQHGDLKGKALGGKIGLSATTSKITGPIDKAELKALADAQLLRERMNQMQGTVTFVGNSKPKLNTLLEMKGFGKRFNDHALITTIQHRVKAGVWQTTIGFGLPPEWYFEQRQVDAHPAGGILPAVSGLQSGTVKKIDSDPDGHFRIQVDVPVIMPGGAGIWARLAHFYATTGKGSFFMPEIGDEVVLGFFNDDPRFPVILGMLYSSEIKPAYTPDAKNKIKAIVTKNDLRLEFNDEDKVLTIKTPGGNQFVLSDKDKSVTLKDQNGNKMEMTSAGISMSSAKDITIKASGKISLEAPMGISAASSGGDISLDGLNVQAKAKIAFSAQGSASAELKASGMTTVKGSMVMIN